MELYISIIGAIVAIIVSVLGAILANKNTIILQTRKLKEEHYIAYIEALHNYAAIIRKSKFPQNPKRSVRFSGKRTKRSVQKRKARNTQKAETKVL